MARKAKKPGAGDPPPIDQAAIAAEFVRSTGRCEFDATIFAFRIAALAQELPAPIYTVKERRERLRRLATAAGKAAEELGHLDGVSVMRLVKEAAKNTTNTVQTLHDRKPWTYAHMIVGNNAQFHPRGPEKFMFGRHGLPVKPSITDVHLYAGTIAGMVADLELLALAAAKSAKAHVSTPVDSRALLAGALVSTFEAFDMVATGTPDGLAAYCMEQLLLVRGDQGSGLDALQKAIAARKNSENG